MDYHNFQAVFLPRPKKFKKREGYFQISYNHRITLCDFSPSVLEAARILSREIQERTGFDLMLDRCPSLRDSTGWDPLDYFEMDTPERQIIMDGWWEIARQLRQGDFWQRSGVHPGIVLKLDNRSEKEMYEIDIEPEHILITGTDEAGLLYGVQTLRQLLRIFGGLLPGMIIQDFPDLKVRGLFYDVTRGRIPTLEYLKKLADKCSFYKLNQLHLYIEHSFLFKGFGEVWRDDTPLTAQDILELDDYCAKLHIDLVPSIATLGHLYKVLRGKSRRHLAEIDENGAPFSFYGRMEHHTLDVGQEEAWHLVSNMIEEYARLFRSKLFNINCDEVFDLGKGRGQETARRIGVHQMYVDWVKKICFTVRCCGKRPMFWSDVIIEDPSYMKQLPEDIICMNWDYSPQWREDHAAKLEKTGVTQYLCPGLQGWNNMIDRFDIAYENLRKMALLAHKYHGEGLLVTQWGDYGHIADPEFTMPGIAAAGIMGWSRDIPELYALNQTISLLEYGDRELRIMDILVKLSRQAVMTWGDTVVYSEICRGRIRHLDMEHFRVHYESRIRRNLRQADLFDVTIDECLCKIRRQQVVMGERQRMKPYFILAHGQKLLNRYARWIFQKQGDPGKLADDLELWYQDYKNLWRETSRESELYRIGEVIFWMADTLRQSK